MNTENDERDKNIMENLKYYVKTINNESEIDSVPKAFIDKYVWGDEYTPISYAQLGLIKEKGLYLKLTCFEKNQKKHVFRPCSDKHWYTVHGNPDHFSSFPATA